LAESELHPGEVCDHVTEERPALAAHLEHGCPGIEEGKQDQTPAEENGTRVSEVGPEGPERGKAQQKQPSRAHLIGAEEPDERGGRQRCGDGGHDEEADGSPGRPSQR
jgi:hypothetical protein